MLIDLLKRWAELEPERCRIGGDTTQNGLSYFSVCGKRFPGNGRVTQDGEWLLCGMIEAAIVERGWAYTLSYPESGRVVNDTTMEFFEVDIWGVTTPTSYDVRNCYGATKLEALLSAYVQALEATR